MRVTKMNDDEYKIEFRVWTPLSSVSAEEKAPSISVLEYTGTPRELAAKLNELVFEWAEEGQIGPLMSLASILANRLPEILVREV